MKEKKKVLLIFGFLSIIILLGFGCANDGGDEKDNVKKLCGAIDYEIKCIRFDNQTVGDTDDDFYVISAYIEDPDHTIYIASLSGPLGTTDLTYNLYPNEFPGWWWTDPNIDVEQPPPVFPQTWTMTVVCIDNTTVVIEAEIEDWEWAR